MDSRILLHSKKQPKIDPLGQSNVGPLGFKHKISDYREILWHLKD